MSDWLEALRHPFLQRALAASLLVAAVCSTMSFFVVLRRIAFVGAGIAHVAFGGVAFALWIGLPPLVGAAVFALAGALWVARLRARGGLAEDTAVGIAFAAAMALGVVFARFGGSRNVDLMTFLFGNVLTVTGHELLALSALALGVGAVLARGFRALVFVSFDEETARIVGLRVGALDALLFGLLALTVVISIRTVGVLLVAALLVVPGAIAERSTVRLGSFLAVSLAVGLGSALAGLALSVAADLPTGATIVLVAAAAFVASRALGGGGA